MSQKHRLLVTLILAVILTSCGAATGGSDPLNDGWVAYEAGNYADARSFFYQAAESGTSEAYVGLGWVCMEEDSLNAAEYYFSVVSSDSLPDAYAGACAVAWSLDNYAASLFRAGVVLRYSSTYVFSHNPGVTINDLIWYQASSYLHANDYQRCYNKIREIDSGFTANLGDVNIADTLAKKLENLSASLMLKRINRRPV